MSNIPILKTTISACEKYRYTLHRKIHSGKYRGVGFIMLNPSTADADVDDPTVRRVKHFAERLGASDLVIVNLFAWRAADPLEIVRGGADVVGPENDSYITSLAYWACEIVVAWGAHGGVMGRGDAVRRELARVRPLSPPLCLGTNSDGSPKHPLYLANDRAYEEYPHIEPSPPR